MKLIAHFILAASPVRLFRSPISNDVVMNFVGGRDFDKLHRTLAPIANRLYPNARPLLIERAVVLIGTELTFPLEEAEALWIEVDKRAGLHAQGIVQRTPNSFSAASPDAEPVAIVNFRPPIERHSPVVLAIPEHAGERRNSDAFDICPGKKTRLDRH